MLRKFIFVWLESWHLCSEKKGIYVMRKLTFVFGTKFDISVMRMLAFVWRQNWYMINEKLYIYTLKKSFIYGITSYTFVRRKMLHLLQKNLTFVKQTNNWLNDKPYTREMTSHALLKWKVTHLSNHILNYEMKNHTFAR